ncbi:uncharacterized protein LDX57_000587 [Aspergillus melleus]|uniref:uncharacterized protein n=1 Tax=Aspergillus melleus TaxID=138277 RepID=UPI001E8EA7EC|nr:uncharacterized protein LDX57_000587 [Aspergillus melleus]KAH8422832.1 hypothetical protein LDX57_000587 [Aspergillus melleus]
MSNSNSNSKSPPVQPSHYDAFTLDLVLRVLNRTLLHPWVAWVLVLCLRAQVTPYSDPAFLIATGYATILTVLAALRFLNRRVAYGGPRSVDPSHEVVIVTGGASGLGLLIARVYGLRGASVAVLDVKDEEELKGCLGECPGVDYYRCDIGVREEVERVARRIEKEIGRDI